jgi:ubiquinone/menaquinone biosynthesis C-methylase UbiE
MAARRRAGVLLATLLWLGAADAAGPHDATSRRSFEDVERWTRVFDDPARAAWQKPAELVAGLGLRPGQTVADVGAGTGYFLAHLAAAVGETGTVYAVETEPNLVVHLRDRAEREGLRNVVPVLASADHPRVPRGGIDVMLLVDTYHHLDDRPAYFRRVQRLLAPGGRVVVVDWQKRELPVGPGMDHKLAPAHLGDEMTLAGYRLESAPDLLPYQYVLIFQPR